MGYLGDTILALPAFYAIRRHYSQDQIFILSPRNPDALVNPSDVLAGTGLIDGAIEYNLKAKGFERMKEIFFLRSKIKKLAADILIYLPPSLRKRSQVQRDKRFFRFCGVKKTLGLEDFPEVKTRDDEGKVKRLISESKFLSGRLEKMGIHTTEFTGELFPLLVHEKEKHAVDRVFFDIDQKEAVAFCVSAKTSAQRWPIERYEELGKRLIDRYGIHPVIFGAPNDSVQAQKLISSWERGLDLCGKLTIPESAEALRRCVLYVGNDTGPMHLAAFAGTPCVAVFSARNNPGIWEPVGKDHTVIRKEVPCACCELDVCNVSGHPCLNSITVEEVFDAVSRHLEKSARR